MQTTTCKECGFTEERKVGREKGADMRIALDALRLTYESKLDVALVFTQDQDFFELAAEIRSVARYMKRDVEVASAFPRGEGRYRGGIRGTKQIPLSREDFL
jgi:uncharacterized LabA/DUF88 family protein